MPGSPFGGNTRACRCCRTAPISRCGTLATTRNSSSEKPVISGLPG